MLLDSLKRTARTVWGLLLCSALAVVSAYLFSNRESRAILPFLFVIVIVAIAARYGLAVGILGSIVSAAIFAHFLYPPIHNFRVEDLSSRSNLAWMILCSIAIPYLVFPGWRSGGDHKKLKRNKDLQ